MVLIGFLDRNSRPRVVLESEFVYHLLVADYPEAVNLHLAGVGHIREYRFAHMYGSARPVLRSEEKVYALPLAELDYERNNRRLVFVCPCECALAERTDIRIPVPANFLREYVDPLSAFVEGIEGIVEKPHSRHVFRDRDSSQSVDHHIEQRVIEMFRIGRHVHVHEPVPGVTYEYRILVVAVVTDGNRTALQFILVLLKDFPAFDFQSDLEENHRSGNKSHEEHIADASEFVAETVIQIRIGFVELETTLCGIFHIHLYKALERVTWVDNLFHATNITIFPYLCGMRKIFIFAAVAASLCSCAAGRSANTRTNTEKVAIVAHRGFWNCEEAGYAQNSVASLKAAQDAGFWGSEFDVQLTKDGVVVSNHDKEYGPEKMIIAQHSYEELAAYPLPNGEKLPTLSEYLAQGAKSEHTMLVLEFKKQSDNAHTAELVDKSIAIIKEAGLYDPQRICFISFDRFACDRVIAACPGFKVQFLTMNPLNVPGPKELKDGGFDGADYFHLLFNAKFISKLHALGLKSNAWTVDKASKMKNLIDWGIDQITTNEPLTTRELLGDRELTL